MTTHIPESGPAFEALMSEIDADFARNEVPIHARPLRAVMAVGQRYKISLPLAPPPASAPAELHKNAPLALSIKEWYDSVYGERIKVDFSPGSMVVDIGDDLYVLRFPWVIGSVRFFVSRQFSEKSGTFSQGPAPCNILQLVQNLTPAKAATLTDEALRKIWEAFLMGLAAIDILESNRKQELIRIVLGDLKNAVHNLTDRANRYSESKWASLQAAEKILKAAIAMEGAEFKYSHQLSELCGQLDGLGIKVDWKPIVEQIQCSPGIRYGQESCTRQEALCAHHASLNLVVLLANAGGRLRHGLATR